MNKVILGLFGTMVLVVASNAQADNFLPRVLWHNATTGELSAWVLDSHGNITGTEHLSGTCATASGCARDWKVVGTQVFPDHNPGSTADVLWHNATTGELAAWILDLNGTVIRQQPLSWKCATASGCARDWKVVGTGNFHYKGLIDGATDVLWYNAITGELSAWLVDYHGNVTGTQRLSWKCDAASGCARDWKPLGIMRYNFPRPM